MIRSIIVVGRRGRRNGDGGIACLLNGFRAAINSSQLAPENRVITNNIYAGIDAAMDAVVEERGEGGPVQSFILRLLYVHSPGCASLPVSMSLRIA